MDALTDEDALQAFEHEYGFCSARSFAGRILDELIDCEIPEEYRAILETATDYIAEDDGRLMPKIQSIGYASIADLNGVFYVDGIKHMVKADKILIEDPDMMTRTADTEEIDHIPAVDEQTQTV